MNSCEDLIDQFEVRRYADLVSNDCELSVWGSGKSVKDLSCRSDGCVRSRCHDTKLAFRCANEATRHRRIA